MLNYADITLLIDRSGSMLSCKSAMEEALDTFVSEHKKVPSSRLTYMQFDDNNNNFIYHPPNNNQPFYGNQWIPAKQDVSYVQVADHPFLEVVFTARPITQVGRLSISPRGGTPLIDAACEAIDLTGKRLSQTPVSERPNKVLFVIITDGQENASRTHTRLDLKSRIERQQSVYSWQFVYLGANQDAIAEAGSYGIPMQMAATYVVTESGMRSMSKSVALNTTNYTSGVSASVDSFTSAQRSEMTDQDEDLQTTSQTYNKRGKSIGREVKK